jgi:hypothetical protein
LRHVVGQHADCKVHGIGRKLPHGICPIPKHAFNSLCQFSLSPHWLCAQMTSLAIQSLLPPANLDSWGT